MKISPKETDREKDKGNKWKVALKKQKWGKSEVQTDREKDKRNKWNLLKGNKNE